MGKEKIKIRYIIFVLITMGVIFFGKITRLDNLNAEKIAGIILVTILKYFPLIRRARKKY